ncbi:MAG: SpoIIE family protein phosphatase [Actinomycetota bacterium]|nr:SpoIIE family protein phosphatase [Actinomycetota bacterium]
MRALRRDSALNMQTLAADAGVSRSTLYRHFPTRDAVEDALRQDALAAARNTVKETVSGDRPPLAVLRALIDALVDLAGERRLDVLGVAPLGSEGREAAAAMLPMIERLRRAAEIAPSPPAAWLERAATQFLNACLEAGAASDHRQAAEGLHRSICEPLDQGLVVLDADGRLLAMNPRAGRILVPGGRVEIGDRLTEPRVEAIYEDGSVCPTGTYPLSRAVRTKEAQAGVRGHHDGVGGVTWAAIGAYPLRTPGDEVYGVLGILSDVTFEKDWELERLRPAGQFGGATLDIARVLDEIPPHLFPEQFIAEARRISGTPVALYVLDIDGTHLLRLAGPEEFPDRLNAPLALGPELAEDGIPDLKARIEAELPGVVVVPMWLRGRAIGLLLALGADQGPLLDLGRQGAAAMELAGGYTDVLDAARRRKETHPAAELQQSLLPPRIARMGAGELAGSVLPSYEVGGDWFDYVENRDGAWLAIADAAGKGATAGALGAIALAALRAARRSGKSLEAAAQTMHEVTYDVGRPEFFVTAIVARWHAVYSTFSWINCGHPPPLVLRSDDTIEQLFTAPGLPLGLMERERRFIRRQRRLEDGERLILHSDGITARRTQAGLFGLDGIERAVRSATSRSATAIARAIQEAVINAAEDPLRDDAVTIVLDPTPA